MRAAKALLPLALLVAAGACNPSRREAPAAVASAPSATGPASAAVPAVARPELLFDYGAVPAPRPAPANPAPATMTKLVAEVARLAPDDERACVRRAARILAGASGAFRGPGKSEQLYVLDASECGPRAAASAHAWAVLVADAGEPRAFPLGATAIDAVTDLDGDGVSSLLVSGGSTGQGVTVVNARVVDFRGGELRVRQNLEEVLHDACGSPARSTTTSKRVTVERGAGNAGRLVVAENPPRPCDG
jgi:hypothetical protein